ncbi:alpha/beta hydrolase [Paroceanicella profunda]|uniref:Alpha/beta hydrolase n=1 Tax=Paroceanicella profunda TaxID=2579971 RepID=A0A5B8FWH8_9RHOB|nr:alpha/beta hydrolase [Paroceanicella profunda]QDL93216.1 alpha/beta hydrolase [Paroceanicella profunda]
MKRVTFANRANEVVGNLHVPEGLNETGSYAAIVIATPGSSVKEQIGGIYASKLADAGFVALTFDPSHQGESGGEPRDLEDPAVRVEDIRCAVDFLMTRPFVDEARVGLLGICAGGGYAIHAALTERRFKAVGTVVANDIGSFFRKVQPADALMEMLDEVGRQRTSAARGEGQRRDPWIPDSLDEAVEAGISDPEVLEAVRFYRESEYRHPNSTNRLLYTSYGHILAFDGFGLVPELLTQPLQVIVGGKRGNTGQYEAGHRLFEMSPAGDKDIFVVEGAGHYDLYDKPEAVAPAVGKLVPFYRRHLGA